MPVTVLSFSPPRKTSKFWARFDPLLQRMSRDGLCPAVMAVVLGMDHRTNAEIMVKSRLRDLGCRPNPI